MQSLVSKCEFFQDKIQYLGHVITKEGISVDPDKIKAINDWPVPKDVTGIRSFMGIMGYYRRFIDGFSIIAHPITSLQKKGTKFIWSNKCQEIFEKLKHLLTTAPILRIADPYKDFVVCMDACLEGFRWCVITRGLRNKLRIKKT